MLTALLEALEIHTEKSEISEIVEELNLSDDNTMSLFQFSDWFKAKFDSGNVRSLQRSLSLFSCELWMMRAQVFNDIDNRCLCCGTAFVLGSEFCPKCGTGRGETNNKSLTLNPMGPVLDDNGESIRLAHLNKVLSSTDAHS